MSAEDSLSTRGLQRWVAELQEGRPEAAEPVFMKILARIERMARTAFMRYSRVGRFVDADDVVQNTVMRLMATFRALRPASTRDFYALVNELIRREFLDLIRKYFGPQGHGTNLANVSVGEGEGEHSPMAIPADDAEMDQFAAFHKAVAKLPDEQREVIGLAYYHGWTQPQIAELLGVTTRTVRRWQDAAVAHLRQAIASDQ